MMMEDEDEAAASAEVWVRAHNARTLHVDVASPSNDEEAMALEHLRGRLVASVEARSLAQDVAERRSKDDVLELVKLLRGAGKIAWDQFVFGAAIHAERVHSDRLEAGYYDDTIGPVTKRIREIEVEHGLLPDEYWPRDEGPEEWNQLQKKWSDLYDDRFDGVLRDLGLEELAEFRRNDPSAYSLARESGRRNMHHRDDRRNAVAVLVGLYEREAKQAEHAGAYYAALAMFGAACEARILLAVIDHREEATQARAALPPDRRPRRDPMFWSLDGLIEVARAAGWFSMIEGDGAGAIIFEWAQSLKSARNLLHAGRNALEYVHTSIGASEVSDSKAFYVMISSALSTLAPPPPRPG